MSNGRLGRLVVVNRARSAGGRSPVAPGWRVILAACASAAVLVACAGERSSPSPEPQPVMESRPSAVSTPTGISASPMPSPAATAAATLTARVSEDWIYTIPEELGGDVSGELLFQQDGTVVTAGAAGVGGILAIGPTGRMQPGWPTDYVGGNRLLLAPDGSVVTADCGEPGPPCRLHRFGRDGREQPGWPLDRVCEVGEYEIGGDGTMYAICDGVVAIEPNGSVRPGWPAAVTAAGLDTAIDRLIADPSPDREPRLYVIDTARRLAALGADGRMVDGWPVPIGGSDPEVTIAADGTIVVVSGEGAVAPDEFGATNITVVGRDGRALPGWPRKVAGFARDISVAPDGSLYYLASTGEVSRLERDGSIAPGWPVKIDGTLAPGCLRGHGDLCLSIGPDGTSFVLALGPDCVQMLMAFDGEGRVLPGWPYRWGSPVVEPTENADAPVNCGRDDRRYWPLPALAGDGTVYLATETAAGAGVVGLDRGGHVKAGWPYTPTDTRVAPDGTTTWVAALALGPADQLFVLVRAFWAGGTMEDDPARTTLIALGSSE